MAASAETSDIRITCEIHILDMEEFVDAMDIKEVEALTPAALDKKMIVLESDPARIGIADIGCENLVIDSNDVTFDVAARISDPEAMTAHARSRYLDCWGDGEWQPASPEEALYELSLASNDNPSPDVMGFEFMDVTLAPDGPDEIEP